MADPTLVLEFLPARQGDAIWIRWPGGDVEHQMIVDMGVHATGRRLHQRIAELPAATRRFELLVNTHVDSDHIAGVLSCVSHPDVPIEGLEFGDVWFNGREHLEGGRVPVPPGGLESWGVAQGQQFADWLRARRWNQRFDRGPVVRDGDVRRVELPGGLTLSVLGPTPQRLEDLIGEWDAVVERELAVDEHGRPTPPPPGLEAYGANPAPDFTGWDDVAALADSTTKLDDRAPNGSSIVLFLEWRGRSVLLAGDAFAADVIDGLEALGADRPSSIDVVKLPHHGSSKNVTSDLISAINSDCWVFSTDGTTHQHPDSVAVARVLLGRRHAEATELVFNLPSTYNRWWDRDDWRSMFGYRTVYGTADDGATIRLEPVD